MCTIPVGVGEPGLLPGSGGEAGGPACPNCLRLEAELRELRAQLALALERIAHLEEENRRLRDELRRGKRQATPFSRETSKPSRSDAPRWRRVWTG